MNLGNISYMRKDMKKAVGYYERAYRKVPDDLKVIANLARGYWETENYAPIGELYRKLLDIDPNLAAQFAYLDVKGDASTRAADQGGAREYMLWAEE
jgi:tetratricopeptide (TPR) repeat protein